ncbi:MAG: glutamate--tRNA ligase [Deltaproteobacteria bacterium]|nr:glutamate--tRNA ligase [Deltaproteobacteria bacterium]
MRTPEKTRVRFAPSPTGELHVGNVRTALFNWLFARHHGGTFVLRVEDTDAERTTPAYTASLCEDLHWLDLDWDEGPERGGAFGPYRQSDRLDLYDTALRSLMADGRVYPCYCTEEELEADRAALLAAHRTPRYTGRCRNLTAERTAQLEREGRRPAYRFRVLPGAVAFDDIIRGAMHFEGEDLGDFIIVRSSGIPAYNFAVVVDDHLMEITHVIRGEDHLSNTALQLQLYDALGYQPPRFAHHALILGPDRTKLSKRHGSVSVAAFRDGGYLPEALLNYLALLGSSLGGGREVCSREDLVRSFSLERAGRSAAVFDEEKLRWINGIYLRKDAPRRLAERLVPFMEKAGYSLKDLGECRAEDIAMAVRDNLVTLSDVENYLPIFFDDRYEVHEEAGRLLKKEEARRVLTAFRDTLLSAPHLGEPDFRDVIRQVSEKTGLTGKKLFMPLRAALTGDTRGPELDRIFGVLKRTSLLKRTERALA